MCFCKNVRMGSYDNQVELHPPKGLFKTDKTICIDACISVEIERLWNRGIKTMGCCCGHNINIPFIEVAEENIDEMINMGYIMQINPLDLDRRDTFYPIDTRSIVITPEMIEGHVNYAIKVVKKERM